MYRKIRRENIIISHNTKELIATVPVVTSKSPIENSFLSNHFSFLFIISPSQFTTWSGIVWLAYDGFGEELSAGFGSTIGEEFEVLSSTAGVGGVTGSVVESGYGVTGSGVTGSVVVSGYGVTGSGLTGSVVVSGYGVTGSGVTGSVVVSGYGVTGSGLTGSVVLSGYESVGVGSGTGSGYVGVGSGTGSGFGSAYLVNSSYHQVLSLNLPI